jgi:hypothetical protein
MSPRISAARLLNQESEKYATCASHAVTGSIHQVITVAHSRKVKYMTEPDDAFRKATTRTLNALRQDQIDLRTEMRQGFAAIDAEFDAVDRSFAAVDRRFDAVDRRFDAVDRRFDAVDGRIAALEEKVDRGFAQVRGALDGTAAGMAQIAAAIDVLIARDNERNGDS